MSFAKAIGRHLGRTWTAYLVPVVLLLSLFLYVSLPLFPYHPTCDIGWLYTGYPVKRKPVPPWIIDDPGGTTVEVRGPLSDEFADTLTSDFRSLGVLHLRIGNTVLVPRIDWFYDFSGNGRLNANNYALAEVAAPVFSRTWLHMPEDIRKRVQLLGLGTPRGCDPATLGNPEQDPSPWEIRRCERLSWADFHDVARDCELTRALAIRNWGRE